MRNNKTYQEIYSNLEHFRNEYHDIFYLFKLFKSEAYNYLIEENYSDDNEYTARSCLYTLLDVIDEIVTRNKKEIEEIYSDFEFSNSLKVKFEISE